MTNAPAINIDPWNRARVAIGLSADNDTLFLFVVDRAGGSVGLSVGEVADILIDDYGVYNALNMDGGGSTSLAMEDPWMHTRALVNVSSDSAAGRSVGSNLAVFADIDTIPPSTAARLSPPTNASGWSNTDVTLLLTATDNRGGWVKEIHTALSGAQSRGPEITEGARVATRVSAEGTTTATYFAADEMRNEEQPRTFSISIDKTAPAVFGLPANGCSLKPENGAWQEIARITAEDGLAGLAVDSLKVNVLVAERKGPADPADVSVTPDGSGGLRVAVAVRRSTTPTTYVVVASAKDRADNLAKATGACVVELVH